MSDELKDSGAVTALSVVGLVFGLIGMNGSFITCLGALALYVALPAAVVSGLALGIAYSQKAKRTFAIVALTISLIGVVISGWQYLSIISAGKSAQRSLERMAAENQKPSPPPAPGKGQFPSNNPTPQGFNKPSPPPPVETEADRRRQRVELSIKSIGEMVAQGKYGEADGKLNALYKEFPDWERLVGNAYVTQTAEYRSTVDRRLNRDKSSGNPLLEGIVTRKSEQVGCGAFWDFDSRHRTEPNTPSPVVRPSLLNFSLMAK